MFKKRISILFVLFLIIAISACAINQFTPKQKITMFMGVYNSQFYDYMSITGYVKDTSGEWVKMFDPELSEEEKSFLRERKKILEEVHPLILIYDQAVIGGFTPDRQLEQQIIELINRLMY
jgi:hypothetical protein